MALIAANAPPVGAQAVSFSKAFDPSTISAGETSNLVFTLTTQPSLTDIAFSDTLPEGVVIAPVPDASTDCGEGAILTANAGESTITFSDGFLSGSSSCTATVTVTSSTPGVYLNTTSDLTNSVPANNSGPASATLTVEGPGTVVIEKVTIPAGGTGFDFTDSIEEPGTFTLDDGGSRSFLDVLPGFYEVIEQPEPGWVLTGIVCTGEGNEIDIGGGAAFIGVSPGETVTCTFENTRAEIEITKTPQVPQVTAGEAATFTIALRNSGGVGLSEIAVSDPLTPDCARDPGTLPDLPPGGTASYTCTTEPLFADLENVATVSALAPPEVPVEASASGFVEVVSPRVEIAKAPPTQTLGPGETASFTVTVTNPGDVGLINVVVFDPRTPDCARGTLEGDRGPLPDLGPGESASYTCTTGPLFTDLINIATVEADTVDRVHVRASSSASVDVVPPLDITKLPSDQEVAVGGVATFEITVSNPSGVLKTQVAVADPLTPDCARAAGSLPDLAAGESTSYTCITGPLSASFTNVVTATAESAAGPASATASAFVAVLDPPIALAKTPAVQSVLPGGTAGFTITVTNPGTAPLTGLAVADPLSPDCARAAGTLPDLAAGESTSYACTTGALFADLTNVATVTATSELGPVVEASASAFVNVVNPIEIVKAPAEQQVPAGATASFTITLTNNGADTKTSVAVADPLSPDCARAAGTLPDLLPGGGSVTYTCASPPLFADLTNVATVTAQGAEGEVTAEASALAEVTAAVIEITKTPEQQQVAPGSPASFEITVTNPGPGTLTEVLVFDPATPDCERSEGELGSLGAGESTSYTCATLPLFADLINTATATAFAGEEAATAVATALVQVVQPLEVTKAPPEQQVVTGGTAVFTVTVFNPTGFTYTGVAVADPATPDCARAAGTLPDLPPGGSISYTCETAPLLTSLTNVATVSAQGPEGTVTATASAFVEVVVPPLEISKEPAAQNVEPGATATFTITVANPGTTGFTGAAVTDPLTSDCDRVLGDLAPGERVSYDCVTGPLFADFLNVATVTATPPLGPAVSASDTAVVNVLNPIEIFKTPLAQTVPRGGRASFTILLINDGDTVKTDVAVSDPLTPDCDRPAGTLPDLAPAGGRFSYTCETGPLTDSFVNVATVTADSVDGPVTAAASAFVEVAAPVACFTDFTATGSGEATICFTGGGPDCGFGFAEYIPLAGAPLSPPPGSAPLRLLFPHGLVSFLLGEACEVGFTARFTWELPDALPPGTELWKYGPTAANPSPHWYVLPSTVTGNVITFEITDGGLGDNDLAANGTIQDPTGPAFRRTSVIEIPTLSQWSLMVLAALLGLMGVGVLRRMLS